MRRLSALGVVLVLAVPLLEGQRRHPTMLVRCAVWTLANELRLRQLPQVEILDEVPPLYLDALIFPEDLPLLRHLGFSPQVLVPDLEAYYAARLAPGPEAGVPLGSMGGYLTWSEVLSLLDQWRSRYPNLISKRWSIGKSIEGRDLWVVRVSRNADRDENEPELFLQSLIHAREPAGMMSVLRFVEYLLENYGRDPVVTDLLNNRELYCLPVANPDGYEYNRRIAPNGGGLWRKNRRRITSSIYGVDLNRNYGYKWGYDNRGSSSFPASQVYRGTAPFSEPETAAVRDFLKLRRTKGLTMAWDIHSYSALLMWPYGYGNVLSSLHGVYQELAAAMTRENRYRPGPVYSTIYPANGITVDWYEGALGLLGFTPEIGHRRGDGFWPPRNRIRPLAEENLRMFLRALKYAGPYLELTSLVVRDRGNGNGAFEPGESLDVVFTVRNRGLLPAHATARLVTSSAYLRLDTAAVSLGTIARAANGGNAGRPLQATLHRAAPPGQPLGLELELAFDGHRLRHPLDLVVGVPRVLVYDPCESSTATWTLGVPGDTAVRGRWAWGDPYPTYATSNNRFLVQSGDDHTPNGRFCYVTGNMPTTNGDADDVDGGKTTLLTPAYNLAGARNVYVEYWRWFMDHGPNPNNDVFTVEISDDDGATWKTVERVTYSDPAWRRHRFRLRDYVRPTARVRLRFVAADQPDDSFCEALVDDLRLVAYDDGVRLTLTGIPRIGRTVGLSLQAPRSPGLPYLAGAAFGDRPGIAVAGPRVIPLNPDALFFSVWRLPGVFQGFGGTLSPLGAAQARVAVPNLPALAGLTLYVAFVTVDPGAPGGLRDISDSLPMTIRL